MKKPIIGGLISSVFLIGCGGDPLNDLRGFIADIKAQPPASIPPLPDIEQVETFVYQVGNRRDPFERIDKEQIATAAAKTGGVPPPDPLRRKEQLEQYELDALTMVGTIYQNGIMWGLMFTSDAGLFRIKAGNYMGKNNGQITRITENKVELTEIVADEAEGWKERQAAVKMIEKK